MSEYLAPGVFVEERENPKSIESVSTSTAAMVGATERGPENVPTLVTSFAEYRSVFGGYLNPQSDPFKKRWFLPAAAEGFFVNGGKRLFVVRTAAEDGIKSAARKLYRSKGKTYGVLLAKPNSTDANVRMSLFPIDIPNTIDKSTYRFSLRESAQHAELTAASNQSGEASLTITAVENRLHPDMKFALPCKRAMNGNSDSFTLNNAADKGVTSVTIAQNPPDIKPGNVTLTAFAVFINGPKTSILKIKDINTNEKRIELTGGLPFGVDKNAKIEIYLAPAEAKLNSVSACFSNHAVLSRLVISDGDNHLLFWKADKISEPADAVMRIAILKRAVFPTGASLPAGLKPSFVVRIPELTFKTAITNYSELSDIEFNGKIAKGSDKGGQTDEIFIQFNNDVRRFLLNDQTLSPVKGESKLSSPADFTKDQAIVAYRAESREILRSPVASGTAFYAVGSEGSDDLYFLSGTTEEVPGLKILELENDSTAPVAADVVEKVSPSELDLIEAGAIVQPVVEVCEIEALDRGLWGNRLKVSVQIPSQPVAKTSITQLASSGVVYLKSLMGIEVGTRLRKEGGPTGEEYVVTKVMQDRAQLDREPADWSPGDTIHSVEFNLAVQLLGHAENGAAAPVLQSELFTSLSMHKDHSRYAPRIVGSTWDRSASGNTDRLGQTLRLGDRRSVGESRLVRISVADSQPTLGSADASALPDALEFEIKGRKHPIWYPLDGGAENEVSFSELKGVDDVEPSKRTGIQTLRNEDDISLIAVPGIDDELVQSALIEHCQAMKYRFAVLDGPPPPNDSLNDIRGLRSRYDSRYASVYHPWLTIVDPLARGSKRRELAAPPSGHVMGLIADVDVRRGVHKAPANEVLRGIIGLQRRIQTGEQELLNPFPSNINVIRDFRPENRGIRVWGARVISSDSEWKYVNVRRLFNFVEKSIERGMQWAVFEPNDEPLWARIRQAITAFLKSVWKDGALQGQKIEEAFFVRVDRTTMTQQDIDNGRLIVEIGIAPVKPAEFVIIRIGMFTSTAES